MTYNSALYNEIIYNSDRRELGALAKSLISAHTGPHIQAIVGSLPGIGTNGGLSFISDFTITEGTIRKPPAAFNFPDLSARIRAFNRQTADLGMFIIAQQIKNLRASVFIVDRIPDLPARIVPLVFVSLPASIVGMLAEANLAARLQGTEFIHLAAKMTGVPAPNLAATIGTHSPANLGAIIWAPADLRASIASVFVNDISASITGFSFKNLGASMLGIPAPSFRGIIKAIQMGQADLPSIAKPILEVPNLGASITPVFTGLNAIIQGIGQSSNLQAIVQSSFSQQTNLAARLLGTVSLDLGATIGFFSAKNLSATLTGFALGEKNRDIPALVQPVRFENLPASIFPLLGVKNLSAFIQSNTQIADLGASITVDETFITTLLTVVTLSARNLGATIGNPNCGGGSAIKDLQAFSFAQQANNLGASIQSFMEKGLGASINSSKVFQSFDTINIHYRSFHPRPKKFRATDTLVINYSPFRGKTLGASITATSPEVLLRASINAVFPLPRVSPFVNSIRAVDLRKEVQDLEEIRLQMEGVLTEFFYVNGTQDAFIIDPNQTWRINIRSFEAIAANVFGDAVAKRVCRINQLAGFRTVDEAVRSCIAFVLGLNSEANLGAFIRAGGTFTRLPAFLKVSNTFGDLGAIANRVFPSDPLFASINPSGGFTELSASVSPSASASASIPAFIDPIAEGSLGASITGI